MKSLKITFLALTVLISMPAIGMEQTSQPSKLNASSYLLNLPGDLQREIIKILATSGSAQEAIQGIRSLTSVDSRFHRLINDETLADNLIALLADRWYEGNRVQAAWNLQTAGAKNWFSGQKAKDWFNQNSQRFSDSLHRDFSNFIYSSSNMYADPKDILRDRIKALLLLKLGFNPNAGRAGTQELFVALNNGDIELFKALLQAGANPNTRNNDKYSHIEPILEKAIFKRDMSAIELLLAAGANPNIISANGTLTEIVAEFVGQDPYWSTVLKKLQDAQAKRNQ